jgi:hypothetical protein
MEAAMSANMNANPDHDTIGIGNDRPRRVTSRLHPRVYILVIALAAWLVLSVWVFFTGVGVTDYLLVIVSGFIFIAVALPLILSRVGRSSDPAGAAAAKRERDQSFHDWAAQDFDTAQGRLTGAQATAQILLPIAAVAFGMTVFGIALRIAEHSIS